MTKEYHKTPLHSENSSNSSDENSPITMSKLLKTDEIEMMESHDYASPQELKKGFEKIDGIKKKNLIYEPLPPRNKKNGFTKTAHSSSYDEEQLLHHKNDNNLQRKLHRFLFFVILLMSLSAFSLSVLTTLGVIQASCNKCIKGDIYGSAYRYNNSHFYHMYINLYVNTIKLTLTSLSIDLNNIHCFF